MLRKHNSNVRRKAHRVRSSYNTAEVPTSPSPDCAYGSSLPGHCCAGPLLLLRSGAKPDDEETDKPDGLVVTDAGPDRSRADTLPLGTRGDV